MSRIGCVNRVRMSDILAPYNTDSRVGRRDTEMVGRQWGGMNLEEYQLSTQLSTGVAGRKNWLVSGISSAVPYSMGMASF